MEIESEETADFYLPCTVCTKNCYKLHGKYTEKEKQSFDRSSYFSKVMVGDFAQKLRIPPAFIPKLANEIDENMVLQGPSGRLWLVKIWCTATELEFGQGWENFVHDQTIESGDFLVFKYICRSYFKVKIFGRSGCEKNNNASASENSENLHGVVAEQKEKAEPSSCGHPLENYGHCQASHAGKKHWMEKTVSVVTDKTEERSYQRTYYVSCRRPVTDVERIETLKAAYSFTSNKCFCLIIMKPSHVYKRFWLKIPRKCGDRLQLPREKTKMTLVDPNNEEWHVQYHGNIDRPALSAGWGYFSRANNLEEGDICIFERIDNNENKLQLRVHIFRVVKNCTPYKKIKSKPMSDSTALPTNCSNKKMKVSREDLATNLSAKVFGQEVGKDEFRHSRELAQRCNFMDCSTKELLNPASSVNGKKSIGKDAVVLAKKTASLDVMEGSGEEDLTIWDTQVLSEKTTLLDNVEGEEEDLIVV